MQGTIVQAIALTAHGNAILARSSRVDGSRFFPGNSAFTFCEYVRFVDLRRNAGGWKEEPYADDPLQWFARLKERGVHGLRLIYGSTEGEQIGDQKVTDRMLVGFVGGGGQWLIEAVDPKGSDYWEGRWDVGEQDRKDRRIWRVKYGRIARDEPSIDRPAIELVGLKNQLAENLQAIGSFARRHNLDGFARAFDAGLAQLSSGNPLGGDLTPPMAPQPAAQLLAAAQTAWVFGGMGSWNDLGFDGEDQALYDRLSEDLYRLLNFAIVAAANSGFRQHP